MKDTTIPVAAEHGSAPVGSSRPASRNPDMSPDGYGGQATADGPFSDLREYSRLADEMVRIDSGLPKTLVMTSAGPSEGKPLVPSGAANRTVDSKPRLEKAPADA